MHAEQVAAARLDLAREAYAEAVAEWDIVQRQMELGIITEAEYLAAQMACSGRAGLADRPAHVEAGRRELAGLLGLGRRGGI